MPDEHKGITVAFYQTGSEGMPVRAWLLELPESDRQVIGTDIKTVEYSWPTGMPTCRSLKNGLWEVRSNLPGGRIARVLFCVKDGEMFLLHGCIKKTQKTPDRDLALARRRQQELER